VTVLACAEASATVEPDAGILHVRVCARAPGNRCPYRGGSKLADLEEMMSYALANVTVGFYSFFPSGCQAYKAVLREDSPMTQLRIGVVRAIPTLVAVSLSCSAPVAAMMASRVRNDGWLAIVPGRDPCC
jgi:hypothetical protein